MLIKEDTAKFKGKAAEELKEFKEKSFKRFKELKEKVKVEVKQMELRNNNKKTSNYDDYHVYNRSQQLNGGWVLSSHQMQYLNKYPYIYCASAGSYLELFILQRFWTKLAKFIPKFVAPSLITVIGLGINVLTCFNCIYFSSDLKADTPSWVFVFCAIGTFLYQTLDALDGKQANKVQNCQIEELTDHGCDAVSTIFVTLAIASATQFGHNTFLLYLFSILTFVAFFSTHWLAHVTHCMIFKKIDVSEAQWVMIIVHSLTAYYGQRIWPTTVINTLGLEITLSQIMAFLTIISLLNCIYDNIQMATLGKKTPLEAIGVNIPRRKTHTIFNPLYPILLMLTLSCCNYFSGLFILSPTVFILIYGFAFAKLTISLVMVNVSRGEFDKWDSCLVSPLLLTINQSFLPLIHPYTALLCALIYSVMDFLRYFTYSCWDLKLALEANIFSIKYPPGHPKNRGSNEGFYINGLNREAVVESWKEFEKKEKDGLIKDLFCSY